MCTQFASKRCNKLKTIDAKYHIESNNEDRMNEQRVQWRCTRQNYWKCFECVSKANKKVRVYISQNT